MEIEEEVKEDMHGCDVHFFCSTEASSISQCVAELHFTHQVARWEGRSLIMGSCSV